MSTQRRWTTLFAVLLLPVLPLSAQEPPTADQIARFQASAVPGPEHEMLAQLEGEWDQVVRGWPAPGADAFEGAGRAVNRMMLGGRFLESVSEAEFMGQPAQSVSILGFDRRSDLFTMILLDTEGTYWVTARGRSTPSGSIVMSGTDDNDLLGHTQVYDVVLRIESVDRYVIEVIFRDEMHTRGGGPFRAVEIVSTRRGS